MVALPLMCTRGPSNVHVWDRRTELCGILNLEILEVLNESMDVSGGGVGMSVL